MISILRPWKLAIDAHRAALNSQVQQAKDNDVPYSHVAAPIVFSKPDWRTANPIPPTDYLSYPNARPVQPVNYNQPEQPYLNLSETPLPSLDYGTIRYAPWMDYQANFGLPENNGMQGMGGLRLAGLSATLENGVK